MPPLPLVCKAVLGATLTGTAPHLEQILQQHGLVRGPELRPAAEAPRARRARAGRPRAPGPAALPAAREEERAPAAEVPPRPPRPGASAPRRPGAAAEGEELRRLAGLLGLALRRSAPEELARACLACALLLLAAASCLGCCAPGALAVPAKLLRSAVLGAGPPRAAVRALLLSRAPAGAGAGAGAGEAPAPGGPALPTLCPQLARLAAGARLLVPMAPRDSELWSAEVPVKDLCEGEAEPQAAQLAVAVQWAESNGRLARAVQVWEQGPEGGRVLASVSADLEVRLAEGERYGRLRFLGGRRYVLEAAEGGRPVLCLSTDPEATTIELGSMPEGVLLATVTRHPGPVGGGVDAAAAGGGVEHLEVLARPGMDVMFALVCAVAVALFAPPGRAPAPAPAPGRAAPRPELLGRAPLLALP